MKKSRIIILAAALAAFAVIMTFVVSNDELLFDTAIREAFYSIRAAGLNTLVEMITYIGNWQSITVICLLLLAFDKTRMPYGIPVAAVAIFEAILNRILKEIIQRPRPDASFYLIEQGGYSFPSGHSYASMALFGLLIYLVQKNMQDRKKANLISGLLCIPMILIGLSRIYLGVHFPTDVLGGWMLGIATIMTAMIILEKRENKQAV